MSLDEPTILDKVILIGNKEGIIRFIGSIDSSIRFGVELSKGSGKNNGTYKNRKYFTCNQKMGVFVSRSKIKAIDPSQENILRVSINDQVRVKTKSVDCNGTIKFIGPTHFGKQRIINIWYGIELKRLKGKNDGSIDNKRYFRCKPHYGLFVKASKITLLSEYQKLKQEIPKTHCSPNQLKYLLYGYVRRHIQSYNKWDEFNQIGHIIIYHLYLLSLTFIYNKFLKITIKKQPYNDSKYEIGKCSLKIIDDLNVISSLYYFEKNKCPKCKNKHCLAFNASYSDLGWTTNGFMDNINEYKCNECDYYIGHIIRYYVEEKRCRYKFASSYSIKKMCYTPFEHDYHKNMNEYKNMIEKDVDILESDKYNTYRVKCKACNKNMKLLFFVDQEYGMNTYTKRQTQHCKRCQLFYYYMESYGDN